METNSVSKLLLLVFTVLFVGSELIHCSVTYDRKAIIINGQRRILISGSIHYPRSTPEMWEDLIGKAKDGGLDVIDTYVFWNVHEPSPGNYNFEGRYDLVRFIKTVQRVGLYVHLRIGPYVCAEWNFGGFPVWLKYVPGISFRTDNGPFKAAMQGFTQKIVQMMKNEKLFQSQGGPIILSQIENEYGPESRQLGADGHAYTNWAAKMAVGLGTGVPWVMCKQDDAPDPVINTCNGFYCDYFSPNKPYKPNLWTESWSGWFTEFGGPIYQRPVQDLAFAVARFVQKGGSLFNYYMYHGGTNFGRSAGGPFITTSYDYDAPIDEYGLIREPKYGHLKDLHKAIKQCEHALVSSDPTVTSLGTYEQAHVFSSKNGACAAFLANYHSNSAARVKFNNRNYDLPPWSISILPDCRTDVFNTARVRFQTSQIQMLPSNSRLLSWETYDEDVSSLAESSKITASGLLEQISTTRDTSDYLWYITRGEAMNLVAPNGVSSVDWEKDSLAVRSQSQLKWHKAYFNAPEGVEPLALDLSSMGKGQVWINGQSIGRYWMVYAKGSCSSCNYAGTYRPAKCQLGCGQPTQRWYHVPRSWLRPAKNLIVVFEELGGNPWKIALVKRTTHTPAN
ncbi:hypothetical protein JHK84_048740 [Glycine max]|nr:hypothetical protein JHK86_048707 [Glycine max]KAG5103771.1 hypothetical protein JHK84_048740 [Glycine max]